MLLVFVALDFYKSCVESCHARFLDDVYARNRCLEWCEETFLRIEKVMSRESDTAKPTGGQVSCELSAGDVEIYELVNMWKKYPLGVSDHTFTIYMMSAISKYLREARERGCVVDDKLRLHIVDRIRDILKKSGVEVSFKPTVGLEGAEEVRILQMLASGVSNIGAAKPSAVAVDSSAPDVKCELSAGDAEVLSYISKKLRYPRGVSELTFLSHIAVAIRRYLDEARERGCIVDERLKQSVADRIRQLFKSHGLDVSDEAVYDVQGFSQEVVDVFTLLGVVKGRSEWRGLPYEDVSATRVMPVASRRTDAFVKDAPTVSWTFHKPRVTSRSETEGLKSIRAGYLLSTILATFFTVASMLLGSFRLQGLMPVFQFVAFLISIFVIVRYLGRGYRKLAETLPQFKICARGVPLLLVGLVLLIVGMFSLYYTMAIREPVLVFLPPLIILAGLALSATGGFVLNILGPYRISKYYEEPIVFIGVVMTIIGSIIAGFMFITTSSILTTSVLAMLTVMMVIIGLFLTYAGVNRIITKYT